MVLKLNKLEKTLFLIVILSGFNWGLAGFLGIDLIRLIIGIVPILAKTIYAVINLSAIFLLYEVLRSSNWPD